VTFQKRKTLLAQTAARIRHVIFENDNALELIKRYDGPNVLFYVDPPYYGPRRPHLYNHEMMDEASHRKLAEVLHRCQGSIVLSGYASELYKELYSDWQFAVRHAQTNAKSLRQECLWIKAASQAHLNGCKIPRRLPLKTIIRRQYQQAINHPLNGAPPKYGSKFDGPLFELLEKSLRFSEILQALPINERCLCYRLAYWKSKNFISRDQTTKKWSVAKKPTFLSPGNRDDSACKRAIENGISKSTQARIDVIARIRPELLQEIGQGKMSIRAAYLICVPPKISRELSDLRNNWRRASDSDRRTFLFEINAAANEPP
jgi:hypothetical protein